MGVVHGAEVVRSICDLLNLDGVATLPELVCLFVLPSSLLHGWAKFMLHIYMYEQHGC